MTLMINHIKINLNFVFEIKFEWNWNIYYIAINKSMN